MVLSSIQGNLLFASAYAQFSHDVRKHAHAKEICLADFPEGPCLVRLPGNLFRYVRLQAAEGPAPTDF